MKKRFFAALLATLLFCTAAGAQSILPTVTTEEEPEKVLSFGATVGVEPVSVGEAPDGGLVEEYEEVTEDMYNAFGIRLGEEGFVLVGNENIPGGASLTVSDGETVLKLDYLPGEQHLTVTYPAGAKVEKPLPALFDNCTVVRYGEKFTVPGFGSFTLHKLVRDKSIPMKVFRGFGTRELGVDADVYLRGEFENLNSREFYCNEIGSFTLYYILDDTIYTYPAWFTASYDEEGYVYVGSDSQTGGVNFHIDPNWPFTYAQSLIRPLNSEEFATVFPDVPERIRTAEDGTLVVMITAGGENFVVIDQD